MKRLHWQKRSKRYHVILGLLGYVYSAVDAAAEQNHKWRFIPRAAFIPTVATGNRKQIFKALYEASSDTRVDLRFIDASTQQQIANIFSSRSDSALVPLSFAGRWSQKLKDNNNLSVIDTIFLSSPDECKSIAETYREHLTSNGEESYSIPISALPIPISPSTSSNAMKLLSQTYSNTPRSKSVLLFLNSLFINRDGGLFDNIPWSKWSIDPNLNERDAANNVINSKFTMGKRAAYQRFTGKDWSGRSLSLGNLALRIRYMLEKEEGEDDTTTILRGENYDEDGINSLSQRLLQLEIKEAQMAIAECEQLVAISKANNRDGNKDETDEAELQLAKARERLQLAETLLNEFEFSMQQSGEEENSLFSFTFPWNDINKNKKQTKSLLNSIINKLTEQENPPPYRGAIGYDPQLDSKKEVFEDSILPYSSPYDLLLDIIDEQLNSKLVGCVLEPTSLIEGNLVLGGAILLERKGVEKSTTISGEVVSYTDDDDDLGNMNVLPRSMYVVECFSDEAVGMAIAANMPIFVEKDIHNRAGQVEVEMDVKETASIKTDNGGESNQVEDMDSLSYYNRVPLVRPLDESFASKFEGERISSQREEDVVRVPLTTNPDIFDGSSQAPSTSSSRSVFSTFNPVKSLDEYDFLTDDGKARLLLKLESFTSILPRPRAIRMSETSNNNSGDYDKGSPPSILDELLLPLVDESIRRQYRIRDAERRKDFAEADRLREKASPRQVALERAQQAHEDDELSEDTILAEEDAELYKALRADITQDEGAYSRFLDKDEWYERETQARIKRLDKSKFGTLLDGIDLP